MITKFGELDKNKIDVYLTRLIGRVFKIIPMNEEGCKTLDLYIDSLVREIFSNSFILQSDELLEICGTLKGINFESHKLMKSDVFKTIDLIYQAKKRVM